MREKDYLRALFPFFQRPHESRFKEFFQSVRIQEQEEVQRGKKYYSVNIKKIKSGSEKRTTLIIKGFQSLMSIEEVETLLCQYSTHIDYFYIPENIKKSKAYMYCFLNVESPKDIISIYLGLTNLRDKIRTFGGYDFSNLDISFSKSQGKEELIANMTQNKKRKMF